MIIDEILISNFQCYYGKLTDNVFKFKEGLNLIIADNAGGKSKLFDAFYWLLNDQVYVTEQARFVSTENYKERLINVRSLEERHLGLVPVEVMMAVRDSNNDSYKITRRVVFLGDDGAWEIQTNKLIVEKLSPSLVWTPVIGESEIKSVLGRVMPPHLKPYMWFQGEALSNLLDFRESKALKVIIDKLSDVSDYDNLVDLVGDDKDGLFARASDELRRAQKKATNDQSQVETLQDELSKVKKRIKIIGSEEYPDTGLGLVVSNLAASNREMEELLADLEVAEELIEARNKKEKLEEKLRNVCAQEKATEEKRSKKMFDEYWVLLGQETLTKAHDYSKKYDDYTIRHQSALNRLKMDSAAVSLPYDVPAPIYVRRMVDEQKCFVCDRDAKEGSTAHDYLKKLALRESPKAHESPFKNNTLKFFTRLYSDFSSLSERAVEIKDKISADNELKDELARQRRTLTKEISEITSEYGGYLDKAQTAMNTKERYNKLERDKDRFKDNERKFREELVTLEKEEAALEKKINGLTVDDADLRISRAKEEAYRQLELLVKSTREFVFKGMLKRLEEQANILFHEMTAKNKGFTGSIKFRGTGDNYVPEVVDLDGTVIAGVNTANFVLSKLAVIMSILTDQHSWSENYTLISDAPASAMGQANTLGFYKTLSKKFKQSIVMTYDFFGSSDDELKQNLSGMNIGKVYELRSDIGDSNDLAQLKIDIVERM